jgi:DNA-binding YbaB/EbfC family protein
MVNVMKMMKQAASMQKNLEALQAELADRTVEFSSGGGMVTAVARGDGTLTGLRIDPQVVDPADVEMLQDLVLAAVNDARAKVEEKLKGSLGGLAGGMPGGFPFGAL